MTGFATIETTFTTSDGRLFSAELGRVESTMIGIEDHGVMTARLSFGFDGTGQGTGDYVLDGKPSEPGGDRTPHVICGAYIAALIKVCGVDSWEQIKGRPLLVLREGKWGRILGLADPFKADNYLVFKDLIDTFRLEAS